jgi:hypothetical protein
MGEKNKSRIHFLIIVPLIFCLFFLTDICDAASFKVRIIVSKANIRLKPDIDSTIIANVPIGTVLESEGKEGNWYKVILPPDESGFVISGFVHQNIVEVREEIKEEIIEEVKEVPKKEIIEEEKPKEEIPPVAQAPPAKDKRPTQPAPRYPQRRRRQPEQKKFSAGIGLGIAFPSGDISEFFRAGLGANIYGGFLILKEPQINLIGGLEAYYFLNDSLYTDASMSRLLFYADCRIGKKINSFSFFAEGGIGLYLDLLEIWNYWGAASDTEFEVGGRAGGGVAIGKFEIVGMFHFVERNMFTIMFSYVF